MSHIKLFNVDRKLEIATQQRAIGARMEANLAIMFATIDNDVLHETLFQENKALMAESNKLQSELAALNTGDAPTIHTLPKQDVDEWEDDDAQYELDCYRW